LPVLVAGGGIGGLSVALTLHQIGVPCVVLESAAGRRCCYAGFLC
jgi:2-polyprenyl-6-methoxyphenol hydroxylase-like FAD-dependent oxidoreductase